jgi:hypothetical protein
MSKNLIRSIIMNDANQSKPSTMLPALLGLIGMGLLGYGIYDWAVSPSAKILSSVAYEPFTEFQEGGTYQISAKFENKTSARIRVVGMEGC